MIYLKVSLFEKSYIKTKYVLLARVIQTCSEKLNSSNDLLKNFAMQNFEMEGKKFFLDG